MRRRCVGLLLVALVTMPFPAPAQSRPRVAESATDIRNFRLGLRHLQQLAGVASAMERLPSRGPEAPRSDVALFTVLSMALSFNDSYTERTVPDMVRTIESGHPDLAAAIRQSGLSLQDYVLTQITLLLAYPLVASERQGRPLSAPADVSAANLAVVREQWAEVERTMQRLVGAVAQYAR